MHTVADSRIVMLDKGWLIHIQECVYVRMLAEVIDNFSGSFKVRERFLLARNLSFVSAALHVDH